MMKKFAVILMFVTGLFGLEASQASDIDSLDFNVHYSGGPFRFSKAQLAEHVPDTLWKPVLWGKKTLYPHLWVSVLPFRDNGGIELDTTSVSPQYLMVLYGHAHSVLVILRHTATGYAEHWRSGVLEGILGYVSFMDINKNGEQEFIIRQAIGNHGYDNVYIYSWSEGDIGVMNPSGKQASVSEFSGHVNIVPSDTGTTITAGFPLDTVKYLYFIRNGTQTIKLVAKTPKESEHRKLRHPPK